MSAPQGAGVTVTEATAWAADSYHASQGETMLGGVGGEER